MRNLFSFRLNGRKSNYFCGESSYVSVLVVLLAILCNCLFYHKRYYTIFIAACSCFAFVEINITIKFIANFNKKVGREVSGN